MGVETASSSSSLEDLEGGRGGSEGRQEEEMLSMKNEGQSAQSLEEISKMSLPEQPLLVQVKNLSLELEVPLPSKSFFAPTKTMKKTVFQNLNLQVTPGELLAIMGPTGCGKTSLLNCIGGRTTKGIGGEILFNNGKRTKETKRLIGYVLQDDLLFGNLTVEQTLNFTAALRLPVSSAERKQRVEELIAALNLNKCRNTMIGNQWVRGVSGGERKRTNIANELITNPSLIMLDEPTSGLDSFTAESLLATLQGIARQGRTIITTIHQPSSQMFAMFDKILLMAEGRIVFYGPAAGMVGYLSRLGHQCPPNFNPADFALGLLVSEEIKGTVPIKKQLIEAYSDHSAKNIAFHENEDSRRSTMLDLIKAAEDQRKSRSTMSSQSNIITPPPKLGSTKGDSSMLQLSNQQTFGGGKTKWWQLERKYPTTWWRQFTVLLQRAFYLQRGKIFDLNPIIQAVVVAVIAGLIFLQIDDDEEHITDRVSIIFFLAVFSGGFTPLMNGVFSYPTEAAIIQKERSAGSYGLSAYFTAKVISDIPFPLLYCAIFITISYWMAGLNSDPGRFFAYLGISILSNFTCFGLGVLIGCIWAKDLQFATLMATITILGMMLLGGFYVPLHHVPVFIRWGQYVSVVRYLYMALLGSDLRGEEFKAMRLHTEFDKWGRVITGEEVLKTLDIDGDLVWAWCLVLLGWGLFYRFLAYLALRYLNRPKGP